MFVAYYPQTGVPKHLNSILENIADCLEVETHSSNGIEELNWHIQVRSEV